jgi:hypothetical protein
MRINSTYIKSLDYNSRTHELTVVFRDGYSAKYFFVHPKTAQAIVNADSVGEKFIELVRDSHKFKILKQAA